MVLSVLCICLNGCGQGFGAGNSLRTISGGSHLPYSDEQWKRIQNKQDKKRFVVWGNHAGATNAALELLQQRGHTIVERGRLLEILNEQRIRLTHTTDDDAQILKVGKLTGADRVVFVDAFDKGEVVSEGYIGPYGGTSYSTSVHQVSVAVRAVDIESSEVQWSGHSTLSEPVTDPEVALPLLTKAAMMRATCAIERGREWIERGGETDLGKWGCKKKE